MRHQHQRARRAAALAVLVCAGSGLALFAQGPPPRMAGAPGMPPPPMFEFMGAEFGMGEKLVKGVPYSAQAITETTQTLADGNRISRTSEAMIYRDSEGRTRREQTIGGGGAPLAFEGGPRQIVIIDDPVTGKRHLLDPEQRTVSTMPGFPGRMRGKVVAAGDGAFSGSFHASEGGTRVMVRRPPPEGLEPGMQHRDESLGTESVEGVTATGTRVTRTLPAGAIGNERPIEMVSEHWYSAELQALVKSRRSDPRMGETMYRLTSILRAEPDASLFTVPPDYTPTKEGIRMMIAPKIEMRRKQP